jgi:putative ABC transport system permease protein
VPSDVASLPSTPVERGSAAGLIGAIAWRNLWRNRQRTWLSVGGIAFAVMLILAARSAQISTMSAMLDNATRLLTGHLQVQNAAYADEPSLRNAIPDATAVARAVAGTPHVTAVAQRAIAFALVSVGERSYGAEVFGVDPDAERAISSLPDMVTEGRWLREPTDAVLGSLMARNLGAKLGDEVVVLGSAVDGGVAALSLTVAGIVETGTAELDRALIDVPLATFQQAFELGDRAHVIVARVDDFTRVDADVPGIETAIAPIAPGLSVLSWRRLLPELVQTVELKGVTSGVMFALIAFLVTFSVFNTFMMTVFERTREFGMLLAIGMRGNGIVGMLQIEAAWLALLGAALGVGCASLIVVWLGRAGIPLGEMAGEMLRRYHMPDRIYPHLDAGAVYGVPLLMLIATQLAALIPSLRVRALTPVAALRVGA